MPEALTKLDVELRVARATLENVTGKFRALDADIAAIPNQLRDAERAFEHAQATVAKIDLHEQLPHLYDALARASVTDHACGYRSRRESKYEIEIPNHRLEPVGLTSRYSPPESASRARLAVGEQVAFLQWASVNMGEQLQGWGNGLPHRKTGEQLGAVYDFSGLFPHLFPRFALDAHGRLCTFMHCKSLICQRKRAFTGSQRTPLDVMVVELAGARF